MAEEPCETEHASLLSETLTEEEETDEKLTELSKEINTEANADAEDVEEARAAKPTPKRKIA